MLVPTSQIKAGDKVVVHMGNIIPFDGVVAEGEAMVNQASLTGRVSPGEKDRREHGLRRNRCGRGRTYHSCKRGWRFQPF